MIAQAPEISNIFLGGLLKSVLNNGPQGMKIRCQNLIQCKESKNQVDKKVDMDLSYEPAHPFINYIS